MLPEIFHLVLGAVAGLLGAALLLRTYLAWLRIARSNPLFVFCTALTEWLVQPLRYVFPARGRFDAPALAASFAVACAFVALIVLVLFRGAWNWSLFVPSVLVLVLHWALYLLMVLVFANVLLSWVNPHAPLAPTVNLLTRPVLAPLRRLIPLVGGFDLSPLVLIVLIQVLLLVLSQFAV